MIDKTEYLAYLTEVKEKLGGDTWVEESEKVKLHGYESIGSVARQYAVNCYIRGVSISECVGSIKRAFPEINE